MSRYSKSLEIDLLIMKTLLLEGEFAQYEFPSILKRNYRTVLRHLKDLESEKLIEIIRTEPSSKGGKDKNIFGLTPYGFNFILSEFVELENNIETIAKFHAYRLPLILEKIEFFKQNNLLENLIKRLSNAIWRNKEFFDLYKQFLWPTRAFTNVEPELAHARELGLKAIFRRFELEKHAAERGIFNARITEAFFFPYLILDKDKENQIRFLSKLKNDPEINQYVSSHYNEEIEENQRSLEYNKQMKEWWNSLS